MAKGCEFMDVNELLKDLDAARGVSGFEGAASEVIKKYLTKYGAEIKEDNMGSIIAVIRCGIENAPRLMIEAHMDELGLMVSGYTKEGSLLFAPIGGFDQKILPGSEVTVHSRTGEYFGVIGAKPPHLLTDKTATVKMADMSIDIGFCEEETRKKVEIGDIATFNTSFFDLSGTCAAGRCFDDRAGIASLILSLEYMKEYKIECDIILCAAVQEEVGLRGARVIANTAKPDAAIVVDAGFGISENAKEGFELGSGAIVSLGPNLHPKLTELIFEAAKDKKIDIETDVEPGNTGTDAWEVQVAGEGVPTALLSFPTRYMHSTYEVIDTKDIESMAKLIAASALRFKGGRLLCYESC